MNSGDEAIQRGKEYVEEHYPSGDTEALLDCWIEGVLYGMTLARRTVMGRVDEMTAEPPVAAPDGSV